MKFVKTNWTKKLIIVLVAIMLFNTIMPPKVKAANLAGALMKPAATLILNILVSIDVSIGVLINYADWTFNGVGKVLKFIDDTGLDGIGFNDDITAELNKVEDEDKDDEGFLDRYFGG